MNIKRLSKHFSVFSFAGCLAASASAANSATNWLPFNGATDGVKTILTNTFVPANLHHTVITNDFYANGQRSNVTMLLGVQRSNTVTHEVRTALIAGAHAWFCPTGYSTIYNPFVPRQKGIMVPNCAVTNLLAEIMTDTNAALTLYTYARSNSTFVAATAYTNGAWTDPAYQLLPNKPHLVGNFSGHRLTNFFLGVIPTGDYTNLIYPGNNFLCSQIFKDGLIREQDPDGGVYQRGMNISVANDSDTVSVYFDGAWHESEYVDDEWTAITDYYVHMYLGPRIDIGQCFLYHNGTGVTNTWVQGAHY